MDRRPRGRAGGVTRRRRIVVLLVWSCCVATLLAVSWRIVGAHRAEPVFAAEGMGSARHVNDAVDYPLQPPTTGEHHPIWWDCGAYDAPVPAEHALHSLEHGAVWISYRPPVSAADRGLMESFAARGYVIVSPAPQQDARVIATAWSVQTRLDDVDATALERFVVEHRLSPRAPEAGALCTNGTTEDLVSRGGRD